MSLSIRPLARASRVRALYGKSQQSWLRTLSASSSHGQQQQQQQEQQQQQQQQQLRSDPKAHRNFYKTHGRALVKALTLAFFSYQVFYWAWITAETEQMKDEKSYEIKSLEDEVRLLDEGRRSHRPSEQVKEASH